MLGIALVMGASCDNEPPPKFEWQEVQTRLGGGLLSVWGYSAQDVYVVGGDSQDGFGPTALHYDGQSWTRMSTGQSAGDLWWVQGIGPDQVFMVGSEGLLLRYHRPEKRFERMQPPSTTPTLFGVWGASPNDVWAVGGLNMANGVLWHYDGSAWHEQQLPEEVARRSALFKVWGTAANDVWVVGTNSVTMHYDGMSWSQVPVPPDASGKLLTVHGLGNKQYAVGEGTGGILLENDGNGWRRVQTERVPRLNGVFVPPSGRPIAVGADGTVVHQSTHGQWRVAANAPRTDLDFHAVWVDPGGDVWAVGGQIITSPLTDGMIWHFGRRLPDVPMALDPELRRCPDTPGTICTWAGTGERAFREGRHRRESALYQPVDLEFSADNVGYIVDYQNHRIRRVTPDETLETVVGNEMIGDGDPEMGDLQPAGAPGSAVSLNHPTDLLFEPDGRMLVCSWHNHKLRRWDPATGRVTVIAGRGPGNSGDDGPASTALFRQPSKFVRDAAGNLYVFDQGNVRIRKIAPDGTVTAVAGTGTKGFDGDGGPPLMAQFGVQGGENPVPQGAIALDSRGRLFIADTLNHRIRMIDFEANTITTVAGNPMVKPDGTFRGGFGGDGGPAAMAQFNGPSDLEFGPDGNLYIADTFNNCIRMIDTTTQVVSSVAGVCGENEGGFSGDLGPAVQARMSHPYGIAFDRNGVLYIADSQNSRIRRVVLPPRTAGPRASVDPPPDPPRNHQPLLPVPLLALR